MNPRISAALIGMVLAAFGLLAPESKPNPVEAARMNNLGAAYMNQQLFEKGLKSRNCSRVGTTLTTVTFSMLMRSKNLSLLNF